jgi:hypothetical protein
MSEFVGDDTAPRLSMGPTVGLPMATRTRQTLEMSEGDVPPTVMLESLRIRIEVLEGVISALDRIAEINGLVANCQNRAEARHALTRLGFSERQVNHVLDLTVARGTAEARRQLVDELRSARDRVDQPSG